jgi:2-methylcitrate dehydratase PrpD
MQALTETKPPGFAQALADRACRLQWSDLPDEAAHWAQVGLLDTLGVMLAGSSELAPRLLADGLDLAPGPALVVGSLRRVGPLDAALINGTAAHALDFDDCSNTMGGHPSAPILPAILALAEASGASGRDFLLAYITGFELETKIALAVNFHHYQKGWHPTATLGVFGAAGACAKLMGLDQDRTAHALAIAASLASGIKANFGTMAKPLHVGHCARNGLMAARLAARGMTANPAEVFEHRQGFLDVFNGPGTYDTERALAAWADPLDIMRPGIAIKQYPCCGSTHPAIDALLSLVRQHRYAPADVKRVQAWIHPRRLAHTNRPDPRTPTDSKFSLQYVLARSLINGCVALDHFEAQAHQDPQVQALLPRIEVAGYGTDLFTADNHFGGAVRLTLTDGTVHEARVEQPLGRSCDHPLPSQMLREKFALCATPVLSEQAVAALLQVVHQMPSLEDVRIISQHMTDLKHPFHQ